MSSYRAKKHAEKLSWKDVLEKLLNQATVSVPEAGLALGNLSKNAAYEAAKDGRLGVPILQVGGKLRVASMAVLRALCLEPALTPPTATPAVTPTSPAGNKPHRRQANDREAQPHRLE
jgi:hypothetical protein